MEGRSFGTAGGGAEAPRLIAWPAKYRTNVGWRNGARREGIPRAERRGHKSLRKGPREPRGMKATQSLESFFSRDLFSERARSVSLAKALWKSRRLGLLEIRAKRPTHGNKCR